MKFEYTISELAREFDVTPRALRHYEGLGLLAPRRQGLLRFFSNHDRARIKLIVRAARLGLTLADLSELFQLYYQAQHRSEARDAFIATVRKHQTELARKRAEIDTMLEEMRFFESQCTKLSAHSGGSDN